MKATNIETKTDLRITGLFRLRWLLEDMFLQLLDSNDESYLTKIHPIWNNDFPGWYLWTKSQLGLYELLLEEVVSKEDKPDLITGRFSLRYYPHLEEEEFEQFSFAEQVVRLSGLFSESGVPVYSYTREFHDSHFQIGTLEISWDNNHLLQLSLETQERWVEKMMSELRASNEKGELVTVLKPGEFNRNVNGESFCLPLFEILVNGFLSVYKGRRVKKEEIIRPGLIYYIYEDYNEFQYSWDFPTKKFTNTLLLETESHDLKKIYEDFS